MAIELQLGEQSLGSWTVHHESPGRRATTGELRVTDRRLLFDAKMESGGRGAKQVRQTLDSEWKANHSIALDRKEIGAVEAKKGFLSKRVIVTAASGATFVFNRGVMRVDPILAALQQR